MSRHRQQFPSGQPKHENGPSRKRARLDEQVSRHPNINQLEALEDDFSKCNSVKSYLDLIIELGVNFTKIELPKELFDRTRKLIDQVISGLNDTLRSQLNSETCEKVLPSRLSYAVYNFSKLVNRYKPDLLPSLNLMLPFYIKVKSTSKDIADAINTISKLVKSTEINQTVNMDYIHTLLNRMIENEDFAHPLDVAKTIYALGIFSMAEMFEVSVKSEILNELLDILQSSRLPLQSQFISMSIYGLGLLAKVNKLDDVISSEYLNELTYTLSKLIPLGSQHISNTIYGLGCLAKAKKLDAVIESENLNELTYLLSKIQVMSSQHISNTIYGLGCLAETHELDENIETKTLNKLLEKLLAQVDLDSQNVSDVIYGLGKLAQAKRLDDRYFINAELINKLINKQLGMVFDAQDISKTIYGLGKLVKEDMLDDGIDAKNVVKLIKQLTHSSGLNARSISLTLNGAGNLAKAGKLDHMIPARYINTFLDKLHLSNNLDAISIGSSILGLGELAKANLIDEPINTKSLKILLRDLACSREIDIRAISNAMFGSGELAKAGLLDKPIQSECINISLQKSTKIHISNPKHVTKTLYGISALAKTSMLKSKIDCEYLNIMIKKLSSIDTITYQDISVSIYSLGATAKAGLLDGILSAELINRLINRLVKLNNITSHAIANMIYGLGELAKRESIDGLIQFDALNFLTALIPGKAGLVSLDVAITIDGLGKLAMARMIVVPKDQMDNFSQHVTNILQISFSFDLWEATSILIGVGALTQSGLIQPKISIFADRIVQFTRMFQEQFLHPTIAAKLIHALIVLNGVDPCPELYTCFIRVLPHLIGIDSLDSDLKNTLLNDLKSLKLNNQTWFRALNQKVYSDSSSVSTLDEMSQLIEFSFENGDSAEASSDLETASSIQVFSDNLIDKIGDDEDSTVASDAIDAAIDNVQSVDNNIDSTNAHNQSVIRSTPTRNDSHLNNELTEPTDNSNNATSTALSNHIVRRRNITSAPSGSRTPGRVINSTTASGQRTMPRSVFWREGTNNDIFRLIAARDLINLKRLLGTEFQHCQSTGRVGGQNRQDQISTRKYAAPTNAALLVKAFLRMDVRALRELANETPHQYFTELLYACTLHERLSIIKEYLFYPILTSLRISELELFVKKLISPLQIYRDHVALLRIVDGLMIRFGQNRDIGDRATIKRLQNLLLMVGIEFHQNHKHVIPRLVSTQNRLNSNTLSLIDHDDSDNSINLVVSPAAVEAARLDDRPRRPASNSTAQVSVALASNSTPMVSAVREESLEIPPTEVTLSFPLDTAETDVSRPILSPTRSSSSLYKSPIPQTDIRINPQYRYSDNDMYVILNSRFHDSISGGKIEIVPASTLLEDQDLQSRLGQDENSTLENMLKRYLEANSIPHLSRTLLVPIESGGHWIGLNIKIQNNVIQRIVYYNNSLNTDSQNHHLNLLKEPLKKVFESLNLSYPHSVVNGQKKIEILTNKDQIKTNDDDNCGPLLVHNFYMDIIRQKYNGVVDDNFITKIRQKHAELIKRTHVNYYQQFLGRQYTNNIIQPISAQLGRARKIA